MLVALYALTSGLVAAILLVASLKGVRLPERALSVLLIALIILIVGSFAVVLWSVVYEVAATSSGGTGLQSSSGTSQILR